MESDKMDQEFSSQQQQRRHSQPQTQQIVSQQSSKRATIKTTSNVPPSILLSLDPKLSNSPLPYETSTNTYEMQRLNTIRGSIRISMDDVNDSTDLDQLEIHQEFQIMPKSTGRGQRSGAFVKIANIQGNHVFSCSIKRRTKCIGFMGKGPTKESVGSSESAAEKGTTRSGAGGKSKRKGKHIKTKEDHAYRLLDTQGLELITGKLIGRAMEARTPLKNTLGIVTKKAWNNSFVIEPTVGDEFWTCVPESGCCLCSCSVKKFKILDSASNEIGSMRKDAATNKFIISMPDELTVQNKGLILLTGLMIYDMFFSEATLCCNGIFNARLCCCMTCIIVTLLILIIVLVLVLTLVVFNDKGDTDNGEPMLNRS